LGIDGIWNDNNEFSTISNDDWTVGDWDSATNTKPNTIGQLGRASLTYLMTTASYEAIQELQPNRRPFLITRSASSGVHKFASSWGGDNYTSWHTLKYNIPMGLHAGLSLYSNYGHDIGGFAGPRPDDELFLRWIHAGIYQPRFCIHSWKEEGVTEVWMHENIIGFVKDAIVFRYKLIPYIYHLSLEAHLHGYPIIRPLIYHFQHDSRTFNQGFEYMLGDCLLIASVFEQGASSRSLYLPSKRRFFDIFNQKWYDGGQFVVVDSPLHTPGVLFALDGAVVSTNPQERMNTMLDNQRELWIFPDPLNDGQSTYVIRDDDGESIISTHLVLDIQMAWASDRIDLVVTVQDLGWTPPYSSLTFVCGDKSDCRLIYINGMQTETFTLNGYC
jgi:alpha-glucosidase